MFDKLIGLMGLHRAGRLPCKSHAFASGVTRRMMRVATLQGEQLSFEVLPTNTLKELKVMIVARKHREDLTERKLCRVKVLAGGALLLDDDQTLESAGLMRAGCEVMVIYTRTEVEAATGADIHGSEDFLHVTIPSHITEIEYLAFEICKNLLTVTIPESVTTIYEEAFRRCQNLTRITLPESLTIIGPGAFVDCESLESVAVPESIEFIGSHAFSGCKRLKNSIPRRVQTIEVDAFIGCVSLRSIYMHTSLGYDAEEAFDENAVASITLFEDDSSGPSQTPFLEWRQKKMPLTYKSWQPSLPLA